MIHTCKGFGTIIIGWAFNMKRSGMTSLMEIKVILRKLMASGRQKVWLHCR